MGILHSVLRKLFPPRIEPLSEVQSGEIVTIRGRVVERDLLTSPLNGARCVYYQYTIEQWRKSHLAGFATEGYWDRLEKDEAIAEFYIQDGQTRAIIAPHRAHIEPGPGITHNRIPLDIAFPVQRASQLIIAPGDLVEITGIAEQTLDQHNAQLAYRASPDHVIIAAPANRQLLIRLIQSATPSTGTDNV